MNGNFQKSGVNLFSLFIKELQKREVKFVKNTKKTQQAGVMAIFRINPEYLTDNIIEKASKMYSPPIIYQQQKPHITKYQNIQQLLQNINHSVKQQYHEEEEQYKQKQNDILQLLFIQRSTNPKDRHSGQIAFPGGKLDQGENDFEATIREVQEEIGLDFKVQNHPEFYQFYLGKLPQSLYARKNKDGSNLYVNTHLMFLVQKTKSQKLQFVLSENEIQDIKFINYTNIIFPEQNKMFLLKYGGVQYLTQFMPNLIKTKIQNILNNYCSHGLYPAVNIGMNQPLWGLTYTIMHFTYQMIIAANNKQQQQSIKDSNINTEKQEQEQKKEDIQQLKKQLAIPLFNIQWTKDFAYKSWVEMCIQEFNKRKLTTIYFPYYQLNQSKYINSSILIFSTLLVASYYIPSFPSL